MKRTDIRPFRKLAEASEIKYQAGSQNRSVHLLDEDSSTALMPNFAESIEFPKKSIHFEDFCFMRQGKQVSALSEAEAHLLQPLNLKKAASGRALLLIHGFGSSPAVYRAILEQITHYDALFCPLLPGHGQSLADFSKVKASDWLTFIEQTFDTIAKEYQTIDVMGLSLGGLLACHLAKSRAIETLFLLAPALALKLPPCVSSFTVKLCRKLGIKTITTQGGDILSDQFGELTFKKLPLNAIKEIFELVERFELTPFTTNTTVFLGQHDKVICNHKVEAILNHLPNVSTLWLKNSAHVLPLDNDLQRIVDRLNRSGDYSGLL